jgi:hypothetical protein
MELFSEPRIDHFVMAITSAEAIIRHTTEPRASGMAQTRRAHLPPTRLKKEARTMPPTTILICGSPADGFEIVGLFADSRDAESYAEDHSLKDWWIAELTSPEAFAENQRRRFRALRRSIL